MASSTPVTLLAIQGGVVRVHPDERSHRLCPEGRAARVEDLSSDSMLLNFRMDSFLPHYTQLMADDKVKGPTLSDVVQCCTGNVF